MGTYPRSLRWAHVGQRLERTSAEAVDGGDHQDVALSELLIQEVLLMAAAHRLSP